MNALDRITGVVNFIEKMYSIDTQSITKFNLCLDIVDKRITDFSNVNVTVVDRVCGKGTFLLAAIYRFVQHGCSVEHVVNNIIHGYDISESQIAHCIRNIEMATGVIPKNIKQKDTKNMTVENLFTYELGNYPFNDSSEDAGRDTNKLKENTSDLDSKFYLSEKIAEKRAVIFRSAFLLKNSSVRQNIMTDPSVRTIMDTSNSFDIMHDTMAVFSDDTKVYDKKEFIDCNSDNWFTETDKNTRLAPSISKKHSEIIINTITEAKIVGSFKSIWNRPKVKRSDKRVNEENGIDFVQTNGVSGKDYIIYKFDGPKSDFKHLDKYRITLGSNSPTAFEMGGIKIAKPNIALSQSIVYFPFDTKEEAEIQKEYLESEYVKCIASNLHMGTVNSSMFFDFVPYYKNLTKEKLKELNESITNT